MFQRLDIQSKLPYLMVRSGPDTKSLPTGRRR